MKNGRSRRLGQLFTIKSRGFENNVVDVPLPRRFGHVDLWGKLAIDRCRLAVSIGIVVIAIENLNLVFAHDDDAAVSAALRIAFDYFWSGPFDVHLHVAEFLASHNGTTSTDRFEESIPDFPGCRFILPTSSFPLRQILSVKQNGCIRRSLTKSLASLDDRWARSVFVMHSPLAVGQHGGVGITHTGPWWRLG